MSKDREHQARGGEDRQTVLATALGFNVNRLATLMRRRLTRVLRPWNLSPERWQVLATVVNAGEEPLTQRDIALVTLKDRHALSRMLDGMEADGWLERVPSPDDARAFWIRPSPKARREYPQVHETLHAGFADSHARMSASEHAQLLALVKRMIDVFDAD